MAFLLLTFSETTQNKRFVLKRKYVFLIWHHPLLIEGVKINRMSDVLEKTP